MASRSMALTGAFMMGIERRRGWEYALHVDVRLACCIG